MKTKVTFLIAIVLVVVLLGGCGAGHPALTSITVTPTSATATVASRGSVGYTATGTFSDHSSRQLTQADGLTWGHR